MKFEVLISPTTTIDDLKNIILEKQSYLLFKFNEMNFRFNSIEMKNDDIKFKSNLLIDREVKKTL